MTAPDPPFEGHWEVSAIGFGGQLRPPVEGSRLTLSVEDDRVWGSSGVNRFTGRLEDGQGLFGPLATTRMAGPDELMAQEEVFLRHLGDADASEQSEEGISLTARGLTTVTLIPSPSSVSRFWRAPRLD